MTSRLPLFFFGAALVTLPLVGVGCVRLLCGVDTGAGFQPAYLFLALAFGAVAAAGVGREACHRLLENRPWSWLLAAMVGAVLLSGLGLALRPAAVPAGSQWIRFLKQVVQLVVMVCFAIAPLLWVQTTDRWQLTRRLFVLALAGQILYSAVQAVHFFHPLSWFGLAENWFTSNPAILSGSSELFLGDSFVGIPRLRGTVCEPLYLGNFLLLALPCLFLPGSRRRWSAALFVAGTVLLVLTWARGTYLAAVLAIMAWVVLGRRGGCVPGWRRWLWPAAAATVLVCGVLVIAWGPDSLLLPLKRMGQSFNREDWSNLTRVYSMQAAWRAFLLSPLLGVGWGQFAFHFPHLVDPLGLQSQFSWPVVNNFPLQVLCETGLLGGIVFLAGVIWLARRVWEAVSAETALGKRLGRDGRLRVILTATAVVGVWSQLLTFSQYNLPHIWIALGLLLAALRPPSRPAADAPGAGPPGEE